MAVSNDLSDQPTNVRPKRARRRSTPGDTDDSADRLADEDDGVDRQPIYYVVIQCPVRRCRSPEVPVYRSVGVIRYHKCKACKKCFKSVQMPLIPPEH